MSTAEYKAEYGALVTLKTVMMTPHQVTGDKDERTAADRDLVIVFALKQPAPAPNGESKARLE